MRQLFYFLQDIVFARFASGDVQDIVPILRIVFIDQSHISHD